MNRKTVALVVLGAVAIYLATWLPGGFFYLFFQREILRHDRAGALGSLLWSRGASAAEAAASGGPGEASWRQVLHRGVLLPLPPGGLRRIGCEGETLLLDYAEASVTVDHFPPGFIAGLYAGEHQRMGGAPEAAERLDDAAALRRAAEATPRDFRLDMKWADRIRYACSILTKMLLWDPPGGAAAEGGEPAPSRLDLIGPSPGGSSGAVWSMAGQLRALVVTPDGVFAFGVRKGCPAAWLERPERWGEVLPAPPPAAALWFEEVRRQLPGSHPLRAWAEQTATR